jgi:RNA polymerase sigma-70 factor (ECF subfamily)
MSSKQPEPLKDLADEVLVERFQATGEMVYFEEIYCRYSKTIYSKCLWFLRDAAVAEDLAADVFLKVLASVRGHYRPENLKAWLFTIAKHRCINHVKQAAERLRGGGTEDLNVIVPSDPTMATDVESVLNLLAAPQRIAIKLLYWNRYTYQEIAEIQGWSEKEVKTHLQNGRRMFKLLWDRAAQGSET